MLRSHLLLTFSLLLTAELSACSVISLEMRSMPTEPQSAASSTATPSEVREAAGTNSPDLSALLAESWTAYRQRFIQEDGRIIDREATDRSTSEGQAYALLRAVFADSPESFERVLRWSENNLKRRTANQPLDQLWAWQWGRNAAGNWGTLDQNFATDADIDAITALILASRRWQKSEYLTLAKAKLNDLWDKATVLAATDNHRYLLPGPLAAFQRNGTIRFNPSYLAPYAFRLFAQVDPNRDWLSLVESSYQMLEQSTQLSAVGLPSDWIAFNPKTGTYTPIHESDTLVSRYSFDATRVWWRVALDATWFGEPRATAFLESHLGHLKQLWQSSESPSKIPAQLDLQGRPLVQYEATSQYGMLYAAFRVVDPAIAQEIFEQKLLPQYHNGFWDNDSAYYTQNLAWFGLMPQRTIAPYLSPTQALQNTTHE